MVSRNLLVVLIALCLLPSTSLAQDEAAIKKSVEKCVTYLKGLQQPDGTWQHQDIGATALAALTLLACDVPKDDPSIQKAVKAIRSKIPGMTHTYSISLTIMLLDRLDVPQDAPVFEFLGLRLLAGQNSLGGWGYHCPAPSADEFKRMMKLIKDGFKEIPVKNQNLIADNEEPINPGLSKKAQKERVHSQKG